MSKSFRLLAISCLLLATGAQGWAGPASTGDSASTFWTQPELSGDWWGLRKRLEDDGLTVGVSWVAQGFDNFQGGIHAGTTASSTFDLKLTLDTEKSIGLPGGILYMDLGDHVGPDPSQDLVGDLQRFSSYNSTPFFQAADFWYQQTLFNGVLRFKIGKVDANSEFSVIDNGLNFLNSSSQISPTVVDFPTYPTDMLGANIFLKPDDLFYASFGAYDAARGDKFLDFSGASQTAQFPPGGVFVIGETGLTWKHLAGWQQDGNLRLGAWDETGTITNLDGDQQQGTHGFYGIVDQTLWKPGSAPDETRGLRMFLVYARSAENVSAIDRQLGGGLTWTGPLPGRAGDILGVGPEYVHLSEKAGLPKSFELAAEAFYQYQLAPWASIQPDLQYIRHPGGQYPDALVGTLQVTFQF